MPTRQVNVTVDVRFGVLGDFAGRVGGRLTRLLPRGRARTYLEDALTEMVLRDTWVRVGSLAWRRLGEDGRRG